jgi:hypothetical protein
MAMGVPSVSQAAHRVEEAWPNHADARKERLLLAVLFHSMVHFVSIWRCGNCMQHEVKQIRHGKMRGQDAENDNIVR